MKILIIQTAFFGDVILSLPLVQVLKREKPDCKIDYLCIPKTKEVLINNPYIQNLIVFDKHDTDKGISGLKKVINIVRHNNYDVVISIQRFLRSTIIAYQSKASMRISFSNSTLPFLYTDKVEYAQKHETERVLDLLSPLGITNISGEKPELFPSETDVEIVNKILQGLNIHAKNELICIAPGSVWFTKRFPKNKFIKILNLMAKDKVKFVLIGSKEDKELCEFIINNTTNNEVYNYAGKLSILQSAELIKNSALLITNDSAPLHLGNAVGTKVIALFGSTVKDLGFYPLGNDDRMFEVNGLKCRPCTDHGKNECPIRTFDCMEKISEYEISEEVKKTLLNFS